MAGQFGLWRGSWMTRVRHAGWVACQARCSTSAQKVLTAPCFFLSSGSASGHHNSNMSEYQHGDVLLEQELLMHPNLITTKKQFVTMSSFLGAALY